MTRLTKKLPSNHYYPTHVKDEYNVWIDELLTKLGELEDIMEKYGINSIEELERVIINDGVGEQAFKEYVEVYVKPYKDIEEELGIDLITLFKAMKNGIWSKGSFYDDKISDTPTFIARPEISLCSFYEEVNDDCETIKMEENVWCIYTYDFELQIRQTMLKDYGKTWALTKEELEK